MPSRLTARALQEYLERDPELLAGPLSSIRTRRILHHLLERYEESKDSSCKRRWLKELQRVAGKPKLAEAIRTFLKRSESDDLDDPKWEEPLVGTGPTREQYAAMMGSLEREWEQAMECPDDRLTRSAGAHGVRVRLDREGRVLIRVEGGGLVRVHPPPLADDSDDADDADDVVCTGTRTWAQRDEALRRCAIEVE